MYNIFIFSIVNTDILIIELYSYFIYINQIYVDK